MKFDHAFVVGVGGTGSHLIEPLAKLLGYHKNGTSSITVIDGDSYEENNANRQFFNPEFLGLNKATATAQRLPWMGFTVVPSYVNEEVFKDILEGVVEVKDRSLLIILSVDNHATRKALIECLDKNGYTNYTIVSPGNGYSDGQVLTYCVIGGRAVTAHPLKRYKDIAEPKDHIPGFGCEAEAVSTPQLIVANACAALGVLLVVNALLEDANWFEEIHFNCLKFKLVPQGTPVDMKTPKVTNVKEAKLKEVKIKIAKPQVEKATVEKKKSKAKIAVK